MGVWATMSLTFAMAAFVAAAVNGDTRLFRKEASEGFAGGVEGNVVPSSSSSRTFGSACSSFMTSKMHHVDVGNKQMGWKGKEWSPCTHLKNYGLNFAPFVARFLAYQLAPKTALEFGCGLGTTSDFVARFAGAQVACIEPEETLGELIMSLRDMDGNGDLQQLALNVFSQTKAAKQCVASGNLKSDLVYSFEVAEHIPGKLHPQLVNLLASSAKKWLVFSAARPDQLGTGHLPESMHNASYWQAKFEHAGLKFMPKLTKLVQDTAYPLRSYDLYFNLLVFANPASDAVDTDKPHQMLTLFREWWGDALEGGGGNTPARKVQLEGFAKGSNSALWPGLTAKEQAARMGKICNEGSSLVEGVSGAEQAPAFESAWGAHFYHAAARTAAGLDS